MSDSDDDSFSDSYEPQYFEYLSDYEDEDSIPCSLENELDEQDQITVENSQTLIAYTFIYRESRSSTDYEHHLIYKISPNTFYHYSTSKLEAFLQYSYDDWTYYSYPQVPKIRIVQVIHIYHPDSIEPEYRVIDKTIWLRLVQRIWKRKYAEKCRRLLVRGSLQNQRYFELRGRFLPGYNQIHLLPLF